MDSSAPPQLNHHQSQSLQHTSPASTKPDAVPHAAQLRNTASNAQPPSDYGTVFTNHKAGMDNVDQEHVKKVVFEMSKDSPHFQNEQRKLQQTLEKINKMKAQAAALLPSELSAKTAATDTKIAELEAQRDLSRTWIHVDMDAFFAAVHELEDPSLKTKAFAVGGIGMISTANYLARKFGVRSAMPGFIALKLCPELVFVSSNFEKYRAASEITRRVVARFDPQFEAGSLDEAYLDVTDYCRSHEGLSGAEVATMIRKQVELETGGLTCSCGIGPNKTIAKICSDINKPNGQYDLSPLTRDAVISFVQDLPVRKMPGIGRVTEHILRAFEVEKCGDILTHRGLLASLFSPVSMDFFLQCALGLGSTNHGMPLSDGEVGRKGMSVERTFRPLSKREDLEAKASELAEHLAMDLAEEGLKGKTLTLKIKLTTFELRTRAATLDRYIYSSEDILHTALNLLRAETLPVEIRLMGLRMSNFYEEAKRPPGQPSIEQILNKRSKKAKTEDQKHEKDVEEEEEVHKSQVLSAGDEIELRGWAEPGNEEKSDTNNVDPLAVSKPCLQKPPATWACRTCTFENPKGQLLCEMCGTSCTGRRPHELHNSGAAGNTTNKRQKRSGGGDGSILGYLKSKTSSR